VIINLATWVFTRKTLAVMLMVALSIHTFTHARGVGAAGMNALAGKYAAVNDAPAVAADPLQIFIQANPAFSPTRPVIVGHGDIITYTLVVTNSTDVTLTQLVLTDVVPLGSTAITHTANPSPAKAPTNGVGPWVWMISELTPGATFTVSHAVRVNALITVTAIVNVAVIRSDQTPQVSSNTTVHLFGGPPDPPPEQWRCFMPIVRAGA